MSNVYPQITSMFYSLMIMFSFFTKKKQKSIENTFFSLLIVINFIGLMLDVIGYYIVAFTDYKSLYMVFARGIILYLTIWISIMTIYIFVVSNNVLLSDLKDNTSVGKKYKLFKNSFIVITICLCVLTLFLPLEMVNTGKYIYTEGAAVFFVYAISFLFIFIWIYQFIKNHKNLKNKKFYPMYVYIFMGAVTSFLQFLHPEIIIIIPVETFITILMYFTIENPDLKMIQQLELAKEQADKANRAKTDFLSSMSHEIRTPLNAIVGFSDCIMDSQTLGEAKENAHDIINASQTLLEIVNGILDISKIEAGKIEIVNSCYQANETFEELAKLITPKMNEKGLDFTYRIAPDLPETLYGDHANLKKVITNLLSNACKYTDRGFVHYEVNCVRNNNVCKLIISVEDSGRGIKKENIDKMFTKFQRLEEDRNTTIEGTGLGLAITKQLIELMGGKIIVHTVYGEGSKFTVVVNQKIEKTEMKKEKKVKTTLDLHGIRILLVDDTALNLKVACKLLERYGADQVVTCDSGFACLDKIKRGEVYDLILLDDMMPKMSGVVTLKKLKEIPGFSVPTIALTANAITGMREKYLADGFNDYLAKPIEKDQLIQVINGVLGRSITEELDLPVASPSVNNAPVRDEVVSITDVSKNTIIPVEDSVEELVENKLDRSYLDPVTLEEDNVQVDHIDSDVLDEVKTIDVVPLIDTAPMNDTSTESISVETVEKTDQAYLEKNGVDVNHALELLGDMDMYNMTIHDFMSEVENKWEKIIQYKNDNDMENYAIEVHSLKSDCKYLGFMTLADIAYQHELKSKEKDVDFVHSHFSELESEYHKVLEIARSYVADNPVEE